MNRLFLDSRDDLVSETAIVLELLAFALAIIAQPDTPAVLGKAVATRAHNCAINWAALLVEEGDDQ